MPSSIPKLLTIFVIALPLVFGSYFIFQNSSFPEVKGIAVKKLGISTTEKSSNSTPKTSFIPNKKVDLPILMYHHVRNMNEKEAKNKIQYDLTVSPAILEKQVQNQRYLTWDFGL